MQAHIVMAALMQLFKVTGNPAYIVICKAYSAVASKPMRRRTPPASYKH